MIGLTMIRGLTWIWAGAALVLVGLQSAEAKTVDITPVSRSDVRTACLRAGGAPFGIEDETAAYGCYLEKTAVACSADGECQATVEDTRPLTGTSLGYILGFGRPTSASRMIAPIDAHIAPDNSAQSGTYTPIQPVTPPSTLPPWAPPFTNPWEKKPY